MHRLIVHCFVSIVVFYFLVPAANAGPQPAEEWGAPAVTVSHEGTQWIIAGQKNKVILNDSNLSMTIEAGPVTWTMAPSSKDDMLVDSAGERFYVRLADAGKVAITPYKTGFKSGVKVRLEQFRHKGLLSAGNELDLASCSPWRWRAPPRSW